MAVNGHAEAGRYDKVIEWYRSGCTQILDERPDIDYMTRIPGVHNATLMGPYQYNINRPGTSWMIPITDAGKLNDAIINFHDAWHMYMIDEWNGGRPAGVEEWIGEGKLELPIPIAAEEQLIFQVEMYPAGIMVQNIKMGAEALGLGHWNFCGFNPDILFGAMPDLTRGLGFEIAPPNPKAPISTGQLKVYGIEGVKTATFCPSPQYPTAESMVDAWWESKYGEGRWGDRGPDNLLREAQGMGPWKNDSYVDGIVQPPAGPSGGLVQGRHDRLHPVLHRQLRPVAGDLQPHAGALRCRHPPPRHRLLRRALPPGFHQRAAPEPLQQLARRSRPRIAERPLTPRTADGPPSPGAGAVARPND